MEFVNLKNYYLDFKNVISKSEKVLGLKDV